MGRDFEASMMKLFLNAELLHNFLSQLSKNYHKRSNQFSKSKLELHMSRTRRTTLLVLMNLTCNSKKLTCHSLNMIARLIKMDRLRNRLK